MNELMDLFGIRSLSISLIGLFTAFFLYVRWKQSYWKRQGISGPDPVFLLGNTLLQINKPVIRISWDRYKEFGQICGFYDGLHPHLVIGKSEMLKQILVKDFHSFPQGMNTIYRHWIEDNLLIMVYGDKWKRMRTLLSPTFSSRKLKRMFDLMKICTKEARFQLSSLTSSKLDDQGRAKFDPKYCWSRYNMDVIAKCCFASNLNVYTDTENIFMRNFVQFFKGTPIRFLFLTTAPAWLTRMLRIGFLRPKNLEFFGDLTLALIEKRKNNECDRTDDFLQLLIDSELDSCDDDEEKIKGKLTIEEIVGSSVIFLVAGYETTSTLLTWSCYRLATNPEVQNKLFKEVSNVDINDYDTLLNLPFLGAVILETLRIDPPIVLFQRVAHEDYVLPGTTARIPKGTVVSIPIYGIHHDEKNFPDPEMFHPNRFIEGNIVPFTFLPFGGGPRTCIGMRFALTNAKLSLAQLIRDYELSTTEDTPKKLNYTRGTVILTVEDLKLGIKRRSE